MFKKKRSSYVSRLNPSLTVTKDKWVVSLARKGAHAILIVESLGYDPDDDGLCLRWFDFLQRQSLIKPISYPKLFIHTLQNKTEEGIVRYCPSKEERAFGTFIANAQTLTKEKIFTEKNWNQDTDSWSCDANKVRAMLADIKQDLINHPLFQYKGGPEGVNCTTWTWNKLAKIGIDASNHSVFNKLAVSADHNIGHKRHHHRAIP